MWWRKNILCIFLIVFIISSNCCVYGKTVLIKRSVSPDENVDHIDNSVDRINYDEYPLVVPKRAAILLDRIMVALHHALEDGDQKEIRKISELYKDSRHTGGRIQKIGKDFTLKFIPTSNGTKGNLFGHYEEDVNNISDYLPADVDLTDINSQENRLPDDMMGLQRRGHGESGLSSSKGRVYWRCYFNAVTCF